MTVQVRIGRLSKVSVDKRPIALIPDFLPLRGWQVTRSRSKKRGMGYLRYKSHNKKAMIAFGARCHRVVIEQLLGRPLEMDEHVHHQDFNKLNCCPCNLILMPQAFNPAGPILDPYTGERLTMSAYQRRYGIVAKVSDYDSVVPF